MAEPPVTCIPGGGYIPGGMAPIYMYNVHIYNCGVCRSQICALFVAHAH